MKNTLKYLLGALLLGSTITACDKFEDDVPPARMASLRLNDDHYTTLKNQGLQLNVLANDTIGSTATLQFSMPQQGTIQTDSLGNVYYQPAPNFVGTDAFTYKACLGTDCATANVTISVLQDTTNMCTVKAYDDIRTLNQNSFDSLRVTINDNLCGEYLVNTNVSIIQGPAHGQAFVASPFKQLVYTPTQNYVGPDEVTYQITNSKGTSTAKVIYNVKPVQPHCTVTARTDSAFTIPIQGTTLDSVSVIVAANDIICPNAGPVVITPLTAGTNYGTLNVAFTGVATRFIYFTRQNAPSYFNDSFQYRICQGNNCSVGTVYIMRR